MIELDDLAAFLIRAKRATYASAEPPTAPALRPASHDYHYEETLDGVTWAYHDTYFGTTHFVGEEVVYRDDEPVWAMNYYGTPVGAEVSESFIDRALHPALARVSEHPIPARGPHRHESDGWVYTFDADGDLTLFTGVEEIAPAVAGAPVYRLQCHGGRVR